MPTYEYACTDCGQHVEVVQSISAEPLSICGACGGELRKVFHPAGILFKGSGFYATDNRPSTKPSGSTADAKTESTKDSKPDPTAGSGTRAKEKTA